MFTIYGVNSVGVQDGHVRCETMGEALMHLGQMLTSEIEASQGPRYVNYGLQFDLSHASAEPSNVMARWQSEILEAARRARPGCQPLRKQRFPRGRCATR
jgi:hypothetical protein